MHTCNAFLGFGILTFMIRGIQGSDAKKGLIGWGIAGSVILLQLIYRMLKSDNFYPLLYFLISGGLVFTVSFYVSTKTQLISFLKH